MTNSAKWLMLLLFSFFFIHPCTSVNDIISTQKPIRDGETIVSKRKAFALGFFSPGSSKNRYVGIWYVQVSDQTVVWVANRDTPINDTSGSIEINRRGDIVIYRSNGTVPVWSSNVSDRGTSSSVAQLLDSGNLLLLDNVPGKVLWQSFDYPTDSMLPLMKLGWTRKTGFNRFLTSWRSPDDPGSGNFSFRINTDGFPQLLLYDGLQPWWRTGSWTGKRWSGVPEMTNNFIFTVTFTNNNDEISIMYGVTDSSIITRMVVNETGIQQRYTWNAKNHKWIGFWSAPKEQCDYYAHCGQNSNCNPEHLDNFECTCLPGFEPKSPHEWFLRDGSGGCIRKHGAVGPTCHKGEGFVRLPRVKVPDTSEASANKSIGLKECEEKCLRNCSCVAYASAFYEGGDGGMGCLTWHGNLLDTRTYPGTGQDLYVRVDATELALWKKHASVGKKRITVIAIGSAGAALFVAAFAFWFFRRKRRESKSRNKFSFTFTRDGAHFEDSLDGQEPDESRNRDLPFFELSTVATATNNFSADNKLGRGGFGSVYKGILYNGMEIAVKRLSKYSGQGIEEFKNEIVLIAKLQHRNLVRILGCCIEGDEKMLIYEYLPNKSLDSFIFDETKKLQLDWIKRFEIICGIARGILYLHQDSRLRIIHRDLKASNVLLDAAMIPKISDFGMARIFDRDQIEGSTNRVVGTYGYMSPEYAMDGQFSIKSDVYSFGILLLEIITSRKNSGFYDESASSNLVGHVWELWREGRAMEIIDKSLDEAHYCAEILRCIQIGLLCVQESALDRPNMSSVLFMLGNSSTELPFPNHPAFIAKRSTNKSGSDVWTSEGAGSSVNDLTVTVIYPR